MVDRQSLFRLEGRLALITGAYGSFGQHLSRLMLRSGADVVITGRNSERLDQLADELTEEPGRSYPFAMDVVDADDVAKVFDAVCTQVGIPDLIINNAGVATTSGLLDHSAADWSRVMQTNLSGSWFVAQEASRRLVRAERPGVMVNIASILGVRVAGGVAPYSIAKAGMRQLSRTLALELARHHIRCNTLLPGYIVTDMNRDFLGSAAGERLKQRIPGRCFGELTDLDGPFLLLASDAGAHMNGAELVVDGGHLVSSL